MRSIDFFECFSVVIWEYWHLLPSLPIFSLLRELSASGLFFPFVLSNCMVNLCVVLLCAYIFIAPGFLLPNSCVSIPM